MTALTMLLGITKAALFILGIFIQYIEGHERVIVVTELVAQYNGSDSASSSPCCMYGTCLCPSFYSALDNLTSNVLINITSDVELTKVVSLFDLANVTIIGHKNPIVDCKSAAGGLNFISCYNYTIEGITWIGCGARNNENIYPVLHLLNSSNIIIKNCSFMYSQGQAVVLSEVSGAVYINYCNFLSNKQHEGHGSAIHYSSNDMSTDSLNFMITNCNFLYNEKAKTVVYFGQSANMYKCLYLQNSKFYHNKGVPVYLTNQNLFINGKIEFYGNAAENGGAIFISNESCVVIHNTATVNFTNNTANNNGGAIFLSNHSSILFKELPYSIHQLNNQAFEKSFVLFHDNRAGGFGQDIYSYKSNITVGSTTTITFSCKHYRIFHSSAMYITHYSTVIFDGDSSISYTNFLAYADGGAMFVNHSCTVIFKGHSEVTFTSNFAYKASGGALYVGGYSTIIFKEYSTATFAKNTGYYGNGGAMYIKDNSAVIFKGNSIVLFTTNIGASSNGGAMYIEGNSTVTFEGKSRVTLDDNKASSNGGAIYTRDNSNVIFQGSCRVAFNLNGVNSKGGAIYISFYSAITFANNSVVTFYSNIANNNGGAMHIYKSSTVTFTGKSTVTFRSNGAKDNCGALFSDNSTIIFQGTSATTFIRNYGYNSGALCNYNSTVIFKENSVALFMKNSAISDNGGAIYAVLYSTTAFKENSTVRFYNNQANTNGGGLYVNTYSNISFERDSNVIFHSNVANGDGAAVYIIQNGIVTFKGNCTVIFHTNRAEENGGALYVNHNSTIQFKETSTITFNHNFADDNGGAMFADHRSTIHLEKNSVVNFYNNTVSSYGGAVYIDHSSAAMFKERSIVNFHDNSANLGGSIYAKYSLINIEGNCSVGFANNTALQDGGGIYLSHHSNIGLFNNASITFRYNKANDYGGAIYVFFNNSSINFNSSNIHFKDNTAGTVQKSVYINVLSLCDAGCLFRSVNILNKKDFPVATSPSKLILHNAKCINSNDTSCDTYYINNIMLGQEIIFDACVLDYYDQQTKATEFLLTGYDHQDYNISGPKYISVLCNHTTEGLRIIGNQSSSNSYNYSILISLYVVRISESKRISVNVIVEILPQCHSGFWYSSELKKCVCYNTKNIISCSSSSNSSTIMRGYWFGSVTGKPTVALCPNDYCNFTCCEIDNGVYHLSPVRADQCRPHRAGVACSECEKGYSLSFDSPECVEEDQCTIGQTMLVIALSLLYWIVIVIIVFAMMYCKATIGSLYGIIYYYSIVDILLGQVLFISKTLYTIVNIMSSLAKLIPQFLGQLCLIRSMSGIDQQFIHFVHPVAISFILIMISMLTRRSRRVSTFVSRGIIPLICLLLLQSYTSVATTSLLLMRSLTFMDIDKVYTYLSPEIEYLHGRHLAYFIVAVLFTIVIVIGFPLLLLLEPFLNSKINFIKIKPLLDQFQYCYKDKYRCFAGYYMICRLVIVLLTIVRFFDEFTSQYLLISSCALMQLIHVLVRPYASTVHNVFDGIILQLIVIISVLPIVEFVDNYDETLVAVIAYLLAICPMTSFITIKFWMNKKNIQDAVKYLSKRWCNKYNVVPANDIEEPTQAGEVGIIVDANMRMNAIVVDVR